LNWSTRSPFAIPIFQGEFKIFDSEVQWLDSTRQLNTRKDEYSNAILLIQHIITGIRGVTPAHFILGIKLNAGDYVLGGISEEEALSHIKQIGLLGVDFIEISGGDYENPSEAVFIRFDVNSQEIFF
jgi:2,4-dienoyl-CoA reductase-like NADH-dependent reductase (Old Yellow Enzyme family)